MSRFPNLSSVFDKKRGILIKKESESLVFMGLEISRNHRYGLEERINEKDIR